MQGTDVTRDFTKIDKPDKISYFLSISQIYITDISSLSTIAGLPVEWLLLNDLIFKAKEIIQVNVSKHEGMVCYTLIYLFFPSEK